MAFVEGVLDWDWVRGVELEDEEDEAVVKSARGGRADCDFALGFLPRYG